MEASISDVASPHDLRVWSMRHDDIERSTAQTEAVGWHCEDDDHLHQ